MPEITPTCPFSVGDLVIITGGGYTCTTPGSIGTITSTDNSNLSSSVLFSYIPMFGDDRQLRTFTIENQYLALHEPLTPEQEILKVINRLHHRQKFYIEHKDELQNWG